MSGQDQPVDGTTRIIDNLRQRLLNEVAVMESDYFELVAKQCPGFRMFEIMHTSEKGVVASGEFHGVTAIAKVAVTNNAEWLSWSIREADFYIAVRNHVPDVELPHLLYVSANRLALVLSKIDRPPISTSRYYPAAFDRDHAIEVIAALQAISTWKNDSFVGDFFGARELRSKTAGYIAKGYLSDSDANLVRTALGHEDRTVVFTHGDPVASNVLCSDDKGAGVCLIDWEHAGHKLPGFDFATLWVMSADSPAAYDALAASVSLMSENWMQSFVACLVYLYGREVGLQTRASTEAGRESACRCRAALRRLSCSTNNGASISSVNISDFAHQLSKASASHG